MLIIENTPQLAGITIKGDYQDLKSLYRTISDFSEFYFRHQDNVEAGHCHECLLGLCYDLRHAFQGDRHFESMENNAERIAGMVGVITEPFKGEMELIKAARAAYGNGNLYFSVDILYPWALYYTQLLHAITDVIYSKDWFEDLDFPYDEYQAEKDTALIHCFVLRVWETIREVLPPQDMKSIYDYCRLFAKEDYYMTYPDMYLEWLCTWWVSALNNREDRKSMLSLLCLELSSVNEEDEFEIHEELDEIREELKENRRDPESRKKETAIQEAEEEGDNDIRSSNDDNHFLLFKKKLCELSLTCMQMYDECIAEADLKCSIPFQSMDEYMDEIQEYVKKHGQFYRNSYDDYIEGIFGTVDWDQLEW